jgi:hypothetical protein
MKPRIPLSRQIASKYGVAAHSYPVVQLMSADALGDWRQHMLATCAPFIETPLERFVAQVFAMDEVVGAYSFPKRLKSAPGASRQGQQLLLPFEEASHAAQRAYHSGLPLRHERGIAYVATLLLPCGMFYSQHPEFKSVRHNSVSERDHWRNEARQLLTPALRDLRWRNSDAAEILATVLGFDCGDNCDAQQLSRIGTAAYLPNERVTTLWSRA